MKPRIALLLQLAVLLFALDAGLHAADMLVAAEEHLAIEVERLESPLRFGWTANATLIEGWMPAERLDSLERALTRAVGDSYHLIAGG